MCTATSYGDLSHSRVVARLLLKGKERLLAFGALEGVVIEGDHAVVVRVDDEEAAAAGRQRAAGGKNFARPERLFLAPIFDCVMCHVYKKGQS